MTFFITPMQKCFFSDFFQNFQIFITHFYCQKTHFLHGLEKIYYKNVM